MSTTEPDTENHLIDQLVVSLPLPEYRKLINRALANDVDFSAFCVDYFPTIARRFTLGMDLSQKISILIECVDKKELLRKLLQYGGAQENAPVVLNLKQRGQQDRRLARVGGYIVSLPVIGLAVLAFWMLLLGDSAKWREQVRDRLRSYTESDPVKLNSESTVILSSEGTLSEEKLEEASEKARCVLLMKSASDEQKEKARLLLWIARQRRQEREVPTVLMAATSGGKGKGAARRQEEVQQLLAKWRPISTPCPATATGHAPSSVETSPVVQSLSPKPARIAAENSPSSRRITEYPVARPMSWRVCLQGLQLTNKTPLLDVVLRDPLTQVVTKTLQNTGSRRGAEIQNLNKNECHGYQYVINVEMIISDVLDDNLIMKGQGCRQIECIVRFRPEVVIESPGQERGLRIAPNLATQPQKPADISMCGKSYDLFTVLETYKTLCAGQAAEAMDLFINKLRPPPNLEQK